MTTDKAIQRLGDKFASLTRTTSRRGRIGYCAESIFLSTGHHFICEEETPQKAVNALLESIEAVQ